MRAPPHRLFPVLLRQEKLGEREIHIGWAREDRGREKKAREGQFL